MPRDTVALLATEGRSTNILFNFLDPTFDLAPVILEDPVPRRRFLGRRVRNLGLLAVIGQIAFLATIAPVLRHRSRHRIQEILENHGLRDDPIPVTRFQGVRSVNSRRTRQLLEEAQPTVVVINGTRIIGPETLGCTDACFLNLHAGITPRYRGVHGGYWALTEGREAACGATVHLVDEGIDTGDVIEQVQVKPEAEDNYATYPYLQLAAGLPALERAIHGGLAGTLDPTEGKVGPSKLWSHPTIAEYIMNRIRRGVA